VAAWQRLSRAHYTFQYVNGQIVVTQAGVDRERPTTRAGFMRTTNPVLTATLSGFVNGEDTNVVSGPAPN